MRNLWNSFLDAKLRQESHENKHLCLFFMRLLRQGPCFATKCRQYMKSCRKNVEDIVEVSDRDNDRDDRDNALDNNNLRNSTNSKTDREDREPDRDNDVEHLHVSYKTLEGVQKNIVQFCSIPRSAREILNHIGYAYNSTNIANQIKPLLELGFIEMTEPDKPNSKNQKYRKVISGNSWC